MVKTLIEPTVDQQTKDIYNRGMRAVEKLTLETDTKYAVCLIKLNSAVQQSDYPTLKAAIEDITGVQNINLIIDHQTRDSLPENTELSTYIEFNLRIDPVTEAPE